MVVSCLPDTGCSQTLISISLARQLQCKVKPDSNVRLFTADGNQMSVAGLADFFFLGCPPADVSADGTGGPPGFTIAGTTSSTPWTGVNEDHLHVQ